MAFLFKLSDEQQLTKDAKRAALLAGLEEQVRKRQKERDEEQRILKEKEHAELQMLEAQGLDMWGRPIINSKRGTHSGVSNKRAVDSVPSIYKPHPEHENAKKNLSPRLEDTPRVLRDKSAKKIGKQKFMGALSEMMGMTPDEKSKKERARAQLQADLAEQVRQKQLEKNRVKEIAKQEEERELREMVEKGLDIWGRPMPQSHKKLAPSRSGVPQKYKSPRVSPRHKPERTRPVPHVPKIDVGANVSRPETTGLEEDDLSPREFERNLVGEKTRDPVSKIPNGIDELTNLCKKLLKEQVELRKMVEVRESLLVNKSSARVARSGNPGIKQEERLSRGIKYSAQHQRRQLVAKVARDLPFGKRLAGRARGNQVDQYTSQRDFKMTKEEAAAAKRRRSEVRAEYAKKNRVRGKSEIKPASLVSNSKSKVKEITPALQTSSKFVYDYAKKGACDILDQEHPDALGVKIRQQKNFTKSQRLVALKKKETPLKPFRVAQIPPPATKICPKPPVEKQLKRKPKRPPKQNFPKFVFDEGSVV